MKQEELLRMEGSQMNREQIIKDFSELYIGQNPKKLAKEYYQKKKKEMIFLLTAAVLIVILCAFSDWQNSQLEDNYKISRKEAGGGKDEITLQMKTSDGKWRDIFLTLYPKEYSVKELEVLFLQVCEELPEYIRNENESLDAVISDLNLVTEIEGYPFLLRWESSKEEILDAGGNLVSYEKDLDEYVDLTVTFAYEDWEREYRLPVHITVKSKQDFVSFLEENLNEQEKMSREDSQFILPQNFKQETMQWRYPPGNSAIVLGILFSIMLPFISSQKDREIHNQTRKRKEQLQNQFPELISKLILLMEAGMSIRGAVFQITEDYRKGRSDKKDYLREELMYLCRQIKNGLSEKEAYELLGKRCQLASYTKLSGLLVQQLQKGGNSLLETLRLESIKAGEEQRRRMQKKGEEMGTKLLFPMIIMLGIVMVFIMVPALFSFQM